MTLAIGDRVNRRENRAETGGVVLDFDDDGNVFIAYDEGGTGWWPPECLEPCTTQPHS